MAVTSNLADNGDAVSDGQWEFTVNQDGTTATLTKLNGTDISQIVIPDTVTDGTTTYPVTALGDGETPIVTDSQLATAGATFTLNQFNTSLVSIQAYALNDVSKLKGGVELSYDLESIGDFAFAGTGITSLWIQNTVNSIGENIVSGCTHLKMIVNYSSTEILPSTSVPDSAIVYDTHIDAGNFTYYLANDDVAILVQCDNSEITTFTVPSQITYDDITRTVIGIGLNLDEVTNPEMGVFYQSEITSVILPDTLQYIGKFTFSGCEGLNEIQIPSTVTEIYDNAFTGCTNLKTVYNLSELVFAKDTTYGSIGLYSDVIYNGAVIIDNLMYNCEGDFASVIKVINERSTYDIPITIDRNSVPYIVNRIADTGVFSGLTQVTSVTLPNTVIHVGADAFNGCSNLRTVALSVSLESIGQRAFKDCSSLVMTSFPVGLVSIGADAFNGATVSVSVLPDTLMTIGTGAFSKSSVTVSKIPLSVTTIGKGAFEDVDTLTQLTFTRVGQISENMLTSCDNLTSVVLPDGLTVIPSKFCMDCISLSSVSMPSTVVSIGFRAFYGCENLSNIVLADSLKIIGEDAFSGDGLVAITIPSKVTSIGNNAFDCDELTDVINNSVLFVTLGAEDNGKVGHYATHVINSVPHQFGNYKITTNDTTASIYSYLGNDAEYLMIPLQFNNIVGTVVAIYTTVSIGDDVFKDMNLGTVIIPDTVVSIGNNAFKGANIRLYQLPSGIEYIGDYAFQGTSSVIIPTLPTTLTHIGDYAFSGTGSTFNSAVNVEYIGAGAFEGCKMTTCALPSSMTVIPTALFRGCSQLIFVNLDNITEIGDYAFKDCPSFTALAVIPQTMTRIGQCAFQNDIGLTSILVIGADNLTIGDNAFDGCTNLKNITDFSILNLTIGSSDNGKLAYYSDNIQYTMKDVGLIQLIELHNKETVQKSDTWWKLLGVLPLIIIASVMVVLGKTFFFDRDEDEDE